MSFPVVFQGWPTTPGAEIIGSPAYQTFRPGLEKIFGVTTIRAAAGQSPVLGEAWTLEALIANILLEMQLEYRVDITAAYNGLVAQLLAIGKRKIELEAQIGQLNSAISEAEAARDRAEAIYKPTPTEETAQKLNEATMAVYAARAAPLAAKAEIEALDAEKAGLEREQNTLGNNEVLDGLANAYATTRLSLNGPRELIYSDQAVTIARQIVGRPVLGDEVVESTRYRGGQATLREYISQRSDLTNPPVILQTDTLEATITTYTPTETEGEINQTGTHIYFLNVAILNFSLQCSVAGSLART